MSVVIAFKKLPRCRNITAHSSFHSRPVMPNLSVLECLRRFNKSDILRFFFIVTTKGPFIDISLRDHVPQHACIRRQTDLAETSIAGAAYYKSFLASASRCPVFSSNEIEVDFSEDGNSWQKLTVINLLTQDCVSKYCFRRYVASPKHKPGGWGSLMDLSDADATEALNRGILGPNARQVYACVAGVLYEFQYDATDAYHGYRVPATEVPNTVLRQMVDEGLMQEADYRSLIGS